MILVDTSVWIDHFHAPVGTLVEALERGEVVTHPFVIGELACGQLRRRRDVLDLLAALPSATMATHEETLALIEEQKLMGKGIGYIDVHLMASAMLSEATTLWTSDKQLRPVAETLRVAFDIG